MILSRYKVYAASFIYEAKKSSPVVLLLTVGLCAGGEIEFQSHSYQRPLVILKFKLNKMPEALSSPGLKPIRITAAESLFVPPRLRKTPC